MHTAQAKTVNSGIFNFCAGLSYSAALFIYLEEGEKKHDLFYCGYPFLA